MAWDEVEHCGRRCFSGDQPLDAMAAALTTIAGQYQERFGRKPTVAEILYAVHLSIQASPVAIVSDAESLDRIKMEPPPAPISVDLTDYEGAFIEEPAPGTYVVERRSTRRDVIRVPRLATEGRKLICEYQVLDPAIDSRNAELLIHVVLLEGFCDRYYESMTDIVEFRRMFDQRTS